MLVNHFKMETAALLAALLFTLLSTSTAQDVRAVDHYISDTAPVAGIGIGEVVPARANAPKRPGTQNSRVPESTSGSSPSSGGPYISRDTEQTISYVEDVLTGRTDVSKGVQDAVFEQGGLRAAERSKPVTTTGYARVGAPDAVVAGHGTRDDTRAVAPSHSRGDHRDSGAARRPDEATRTGNPRESTRDSGAGYSRDDTRPVTPSRVVPIDSGLPRRQEGSTRAGVGSGGPRDGYSGNAAAGIPGSDYRDVVPSRPRDDRPNSSQQYDGDSSRAALSGSPRGDDRGASTPSRNVPGRDSATVGNTHKSHEDGPVYTRKEQAAVTGVASHEFHPGNGREDIRDPVPVNSRGEAAVNPSRDSVVGERDRHTAIDRTRDGVYDNSRDTSVEHSRDDSFDNSRDESFDYSRDRVGGQSQGSAYDNSRGTSGIHSQGAVADHSRETIDGYSRDTVVDHSRDRVVEHSHAPVADHSRDTFVDGSRDDIEVPYKPTEAEYHRESAMGNSWDTYGVTDEKSERDSVLARPQEYPRDGSVEEPLYISEDVEGVQSDHSFGSVEDSEDMDVAHSTRPLPKTQKPRQVSATPERRGARGPHPPSTCPSVFSYEGTRAGKDRWYGVVLITTDETLTGIRLEIRLDKRADLLGTWLGEVSSVDNIRYTIWNGRRKVEPGPPLSVKIFVKFNEQEYEPPRVRTIRLNGRQICPKEKGVMPMPPRPPARPPGQVTHRPGQQGTRPVQRPNRPAGVQNPNRPQGTSRPHQKPAPPSTGGHSVTTELVDGVACGRIEVQPSPLITYGQRTARGQWPWHAAIYQSKGTDLSYTCGGSLIGKRIILTAAHCVSRRYIDRPVDPESLVVYLGKYHLKLWSEGGVQDKQVLEVHVHPEYNSTDFRADIAILILSSQVEFTVYVKPICLWDRNRPNLNEVEGHEGVVVGWGYDESGMVTEDLMMAKMPVVSQQTCIWSYPQFFSHFTSDRTYCAGFRNGTSVCNGDSGGGMVFPKTTGIGPHEKTTTWALRGIVSLSTSQANKKVCNTDHYVVFTDVVRFYDWINKYH